ncbi:Oidioi.mRNA.OKI2018_I69.XSR.g16885.t1.cds [Oikopleura dioica]|uniref:Oidioi.mRNA.OKI2018_I69.XSR.g16885.t1.cds n=1 Tax=Oikopleura dioica TaxID=34765 RepID=A0ABN7SI08_OIKDI|nr:Oidioi.mRNA.OKI2018_I69.XSR.g16885.t1.cds [Oikopleura dioica]
MTKAEFCFGNILFGTFGLVLTTCGVALMWEYMEDWAGGIEGGFDNPGSSEYGNFHVLFMLFAFFLPFAIGAASFRLFTFVDRSIAKIFHAVFNTIGLGGAIAGFYIEYDTIEINGYDHFNSAHTYMGLLTLALYLFQWISGLVLFAICIPFKGTVMSAIKKGWLPIHRLIGQALFLFLSVTIVLGMMMKFVYTGFMADPDQFRLSNIVMSYFVVGVCTYGTYLITGIFQRKEKSQASTASSAAYVETNDAFSPDTTVKI